MLTIKVYVDKNQVDELQILNLNHKKKIGLSVYTLYEATLVGTGKKILVYHKRDKKWSVLVRKVLEKLENVK